MKQKKKTHDFSMYAQSMLYKTALIEILNRKKKERKFTNEHSSAK